MYHNQDLVCNFWKDKEVNKAPEEISVPVHEYKFNHGESQ